MEIAIQLSHAVLSHLFEPCRFQKTASAVAKFNGGVAADLTFRLETLILCANGLGFVPGRRLASVYRGRSLFQGNTFRPYQEL